MGGLSTVLATAGGVTRTAVEGNVLPLLAQASAHSTCAAEETFDRFFCFSIALQQRMFAMPLMLQWFSPPKLSGTPAKAPPNSTSKRNKDASRDFMATGNVRNNFMRCQELGLLRCASWTSQCKARTYQFPTVLMANWPAACEFITNSCETSRERFGGVAHQHPHL